MTQEQQRLKALAELIGGSKLARLMGKSPSSINRRIAGEIGISKGFMVQVENAVDKYVRDIQAAMTALATVMRVKGE